MRISRYQMFMEIAHVVAKRSTCFRESVGCILVRDNKVVSIGYNGAPRGEPHCTHHPEGKCSKAVHAEINALEFALANKEGPCDLYVTHLPCSYCTKAIIKSTMIDNVFFSTMYGDPEPIYSQLNSKSIRLYRVMPSGDITSYNREEVYYEFFE